MVSSSAMGRPMEGKAGKGAISVAVFNAKAYEEAEIARAIALSQEGEMEGGMEGQRKELTATLSRAEQLAVRVLERVFQSVVRQDALLGGYFSGPVDANHCPDYYRVIDNPVWLGLIKAKAKRGVYAVLARHSGGEAAASMAAAEDRISAGQSTEVAEGRDEREKMASDDALTAEKASETESNQKSAEKEDEVQDESVSSGDKEDEDETARAYSLFQRMADFVKRDLTTMEENAIKYNGAENHIVAAAASLRQRAAMAFQSVSTVCTMLFYVLSQLIGM